MKVEEVIDALTTRFSLSTRAKFRLGTLPSGWGWFLVPVPGYVESSAYGPVPTREVEWVEIDPLVPQHIGRLVPPRLLDHTPELLHQLAEHGIPVQLVEGRIRIRFPAP
ncbi:hypothetical protein GO988_23045 [Hymenobacter sp. HMF4947]|uniref:Uncharacterized protein n=1 Tax=Hymenobacter ginkgonis TaxID=2682976 RepID=A0A7K1TLC7_9BACT|nr:DUF6678 family protein [Hymenobacter ginkgonis]MVN79219.1 hypothetical protein [Hymenobacter ginkgonis]